MVVKLEAKELTSPGRALVRLPLLHDIDRLVSIRLLVSLNTRFVTSNTILTWTLRLRLNHLCLRRFKLLPRDEELLLVMARMDFTRNAAASEAGWCNMALSSETVQWQCAPRRRSHGC